MIDVRSVAKKELGKWRWNCHSHPPGEYAMNSYAPDSFPGKSTKKSSGRSWILLSGLLAAALLFDSGASAEQASPATAGLHVGKVAPAFTLLDQNGKKVSLASQLKKGPVAVVFHRSVDWCLYCKLQMVQLQRNLKEIEAAGGQVVGISYDPVDKLKDYADRTKVTFPLLSDVGSKTIDAYDIRSKAENTKPAGYSYHATFIIDQSGVIRAKLFQLSYQERPVVEALIKALKEARNLKGVTKS